MRVEQNRSKWVRTPFGCGVVIVIDVVKVLGLNYNSKTVQFFGG